MCRYVRLRSDSLQLPGRAGKLVLATRNVRRKTGSRTVVVGSPIGGDVSGAFPRMIVPARPGSNSTQLRQRICAALLHVARRALLLQIG